MLSTLKKTCHDDQNMTRFVETLIQLVVTWKETCHDLKKCDTILGEFLCLFKLKSILKTRVMICAEQSAILRLQDG